MRGIAWTPERIEHLTKLWLDGYSATEIANIMQLGSRNSVIGKVHRLGIKRDLPATPSGLRQPKQPRTNKQKRTHKKPRVVNAAWPKDDVRQLIELWKAKKTAKQIARKMNRSLPSIRSKMHKMGLKGNSHLRALNLKNNKYGRFNYGGNNFFEDWQSQTTSQPPVFAPRIKKRPHITDRAKAIAEANRNTQGLTIMDLGPRQCRFGTNDPKPGHLHLFCGQKTPAGQSYCDAHAAIVYRAEEDA